MQEIERRFLGRIDDPELPGRAHEVWRIRQAYLGVAGPTVRIRQLNGEYILGIKTGDGLVRREVEVRVDGAAAAELFAMAGDVRLEKVRYRYARWEVDVFAGKLEGLVTAEVELVREDEPLPPPPPGLTLVREVTGDRRFTSHGLALLTEAEAPARVRAILRDLER